MSAKVWALLLLAGAVASVQALGSQVSIEEFPSLVQVEFYDQSSNTWLQQGTGVVITNRHILSSATCFYAINVNYRRVRAGTSTRGVDGQVQTVSSASVPDYFGTLDLEGDIAVVALGGYLTLGASVQQAPILGQGIELPYGLPLDFASWGTTAQGGKEADDRLYSTQLIVQDSMACLEHYLGAFGVYVSENMICTGLGYNSGRDIDVEQDIGAGLFLQGTLVGVLSFGSANANDADPAVATNVGSYTGWIIETAV